MLRQIVKNCYVCHGQEYLLRGEPKPHTKNGTVHENYSYKHTPKEIAMGDRESSLLRSIANHNGSSVRSVKNRRVPSVSPLQVVNGKEGSPLRYMENREGSPQTFLKDGNCTVLLPEETSPQVSELTNG